MEATDVKKEMEAAEEMEAMEANDTRLYLICADYRRAPLALREAMAYGRHPLPDPSALLARMPGISEALWIESCDRIGALLLAGSEAAACAAVSALWREHAGVEPWQFDEISAVYGGAGVIHHVLGLLCGLDTALPASLHLRHELHRACRNGRNSHGTGPWLEALCRALLDLSESLVPGAETADGPPPCSLSQESAVSRAVVALLRQHFGLLEGRHILLLGAGRLSATLAPGLRGSGARLSIAGPDGPAARDLALCTDACWIPMSALQEEWPSHDVLISAAIPPLRCVSPTAWSRAGAGARTRLMLDLSFPRSIAPDTASVMAATGIPLYNLDDIARRVHSVDVERDQFQLRLTVQEAAAQLRGWLPEPAGRLFPAAI